VWIGLIWLKEGRSSRLLCTWWWPLRFHKMRGIFWPAEETLASQKGLPSLPSTPWSRQNSFPPTQLYRSLILALQILHEVYEQRYGLRNLVDFHSIFVSTNFWEIFPNNISRPANYSSAWVTSLSCRLKPQNVMST
jgi:hypothetical protein